MASLCHRSPFTPPPSPPITPSFGLRSHIRCPSEQVIYYLPRPLYLFLPPPVFRVATVSLYRLSLLRVNVRVSDDTCTQQAGINMRHAVHVVDYLASVARVRSYDSTLSPSAPCCCETLPQQPCPPLPLPNCLDRSHCERRRLLSAGPLRPLSYAQPLARPRPRRQYRRHAGIRLHHYKCPIRAVRCRRRLRRRRKQLGGHCHAHFLRRHRSLEALVRSAICMGCRGGVLRLPLLHSTVWPRIAALCGVHSSSVASAPVCRDNRAHRCRADDHAHRVPVGARRVP